MMKYIRNSTHRKVCIFVQTVGCNRPSHTVMNQPNPFSPLSHSTYIHIALPSAKILIRWLLKSHLIRIYSLQIVSSLLPPLFATTDVSEIKDEWVHSCQKLIDVMIIEWQTKYVNVQTGLDLLQSLRYCRVSFFVYEYKERVIVCKLL